MMYAIIALPQTLVTEDKLQLYREASLLENRSCQGKVSTLRPARKKQFAILS